MSLLIQPALLAAACPAAPCRRRSRGTPACARALHSTGDAAAAPQAGASAPQPSRRAALSAALAACVLRAERPVAAADSGDWSSPGLAKGGESPTCAQKRHLWPTLSRLSELGASQVPAHRERRHLRGDHPGQVRRASRPADTWPAAGDSTPPPVPSSGEQAKAGDNIQYDYTLRRANGYFIFATVACGIGCGDGTPEVAQLGKTALIAGLEELLTGMRPGEKRRALIPPALGYVRWAQMLACFTRCSLSVALSCAGTGCCRSRRTSGSAARCRCTARSRWCSKFASLRSASDELAFVCCSQKGLCVARMRGIEEYRARGTSLSSGP